MMEGMKSVQVFSVVIKYCEYLHVPGSMIYTFL